VVSEELSPKEAEILKQVEFYFSDSNLPTDKFLRDQTQADSGWVSISTLASFKRMRAISSDVKLITQALRKSPTLLEVNVEGTKVKRKVPLPEDVHQATLRRTIYAKGFPDGTTIENVKDLFAKHGVNVRCVRLRRQKAQDKKFKGSVFVELGSEAEAEACAAKHITLEGKDQPLLLMTKSAFDNVLLRAAYIEMKRQERSQKKKEEKVGEDKKKKRKREADEADGKADKQEWKKNLIVKLEGAKEVDGEQIKAYFVDLGFGVELVEYTKGATSGVVRLAENAENGGASAAVQKAEETKSLLGGAVPTLKALQGAEEEEYWKTANEAKKAKKRKSVKGAGRGRGGRRGRRGAHHHPSRDGNYHKRRREDSD